MFVAIGWNRMSIFLPHYPLAQQVWENSLANRCFGTSLVRFIRDPAYKVGSDEEGIFLAIVRLAFTVSYFLLSSSG